jgi:hypothetical protein
MTYRAIQILLISSTLVLSWLAMQVVHEFVARAGTEFRSWAGAWAG